MHQPNIRTVEAAENGRVRMTAIQKRTVVETRGTHDRSTGKPRRLWRID